MHERKRGKVLNWYFQKIDQDIKDWLLPRITATQTCASKEHIAHSELQESHPAAPHVNPSIETPVEKPVENLKPPHAAVDEPAEDPVHEIVTREKDTGAQVAIQTQVLVKHE
jgi:hypothetical protein